MEYTKLQDKCRGTLVGGAVGDALGYEVEFMSMKSILKKYGENGITRFSSDKNHLAHFSDDTQMSLFTLEGLMNGVMASKAGPVSDILPHIKEAYLNWYKTQTLTPRQLQGSWLGNIKALWARRAPGLTCMSALEALEKEREVHNTSKGCGGVMRVAPIGIFNAAHRHIYSFEDTAILAGRAAELTHKHIASTLASALLATTVENCIIDETVDRMQLSFILTGGMMMLRRYFPGHDEEIKEFCSLIEKAMELGKGDIPEREAIAQLGEGWVGDEALAIAVFSVMRHIDDFEKCIVCAVNHDGDSDSTGAIAGNVIGAILGYSAIPRHFLDTLELEPVLVSMADDLCADVNNREVNLRIGNRYIKHLPADVSPDYL